MDGRITADYVEGLSCEFGSGKIGGWIIRDVFLKSDGAETGVYCGIYSGNYATDKYYTTNKPSLVTPGTYSNGRFYAGAPSSERISQSKFTVLDDGSLYAEAAKITGEIIATSGSFSGSIVATNNTNSENKTLINENGIYFGNPFNTDSPSYIGDSDYSINNEGGEWAMMNIAIYSAPTITVTEDAWQSGVWYLKGWTITPDKISLRASYNGNDGTTITKNGTISASDRNVKNGIDLFSDKYDVFFDNLIPRIYKYNHDTGNQVHSGYVAQEVDNALKVAGLAREHFAALCVECEGTSKEKWGLMYDEFISLNTWQIQKLKARIEIIEKILFNS